MSSERAAELMDALKEILERFLGDRDMDGLLDDYDTVHDIASETLDLAEGLEGDVGAEILRTLKELFESFSKTFNDNLPKMVTAVYENAQKEIAQAKTIAEKDKALSEAIAPLERIREFPDHSDHPVLCRALKALEQYQGSIDRAYAENQRSKRKKSLEKP